MPFFIFQSRCMFIKCVDTCTKDNKFHVSTSFFFKSIPLLVFISTKIYSNNDVLSINKETQCNQTFGKYLS